MKKTMIGKAKNGGAKGCGTQVLEPRDLFAGTRIPLGTVVKVEWLDEHPRLAEQELLCFTTTIGLLTGQDDECIAVANRINALDDGEMSLLPLERVLTITVFHE